MKIATCTLESTAPYSPSRNYAHEVERLPKETPDAYEQRTWREKCHTMADGKVYIPPMAFKMGMDKAIKDLGRQIPGKGKTTYTKFFVSGVLVMEPLILPYSKDDAKLDRIYANADGIRGSGKRVWRNFPRFDQWSGDLQVHVLADEITEDVFEEAIKQAGAFVGVGRFRPANGGYYGRYKVNKIKWN